MAAATRTSSRSGFDPFLQPETRLGSSVDCVTRKPRELPQSPMDAAQRRLSAVSAHLQPPAPTGGNGLATSPTAGEYAHVEGYSVVLPEKLQTGKWNVYQSAQSPLRYSVETFGDCNYLGTRISADGTVGDGKYCCSYKWMTYGQASMSRTAIGSGLMYHGILEDNLKLMDDLAALKPTIFASVPRLYNRIYAAITNAVKESGGLKEKLFHTAYNTKRQAIAKGRNPSPVWDKLVFNKIKARLGGQVRLMSSGASPLSPNIMEFLRICFGCEVLEGYGMTETSCTISAMDIGDKLIGHVGSPNPSCEIKLVDVPEMSYTSEDQPYLRGEICGDVIHAFETCRREIFDEDGWLHTGDIGLWLPGGRLKIIDRKKNISKLAQGEYIAPEKIENVYAKCNFIAQCFIYGDSLNSFLVAIIAVEPEVLKAWAASEGIQYEDLRQLCADLRTRAAVLADMDSIGRKPRGVEFAKAVALVAEPFTMENGLLTPTFKVKRPQAKAYFAKEISDMYAQLQATESPRQKL
ncbi:hypothetical protein PR202_ga04043 [Eleusine coracana subsp. coracana]|uniref:AMP-dependent synthetase/ligase domain-containing protein n=1 Tax=Eleusine coracana subsp. coracana TaxID=191504 RepID=A0AAV5BPB3_ELECO|nr:hypothetical protein PR202_ga04043 [Eleusine coracana subsp. coracana]